MKAKNNARFKKEVALVVLALLLALRLDMLELYRSVFSMFLIGISVGWRLG